MPETRCTDLVDDGAPLTPGCPKGASCPTTPDCTFCQDCADAAGIGAPLADGKYELVDVSLYVSACGTFNTTTASGVLVVSGSTLSVAWTRPVALGETGPETAVYDFHIDGSELVVTETCPEPSEPTRVSFANANGVLYFWSQLPGQVDFEAVFERR